MTKIPMLRNAYRYKTALWLMAFMLGAACLAGPQTAAKADPDALAFQVSINQQPVNLPNAGILRGGRIWVRAHADVFSLLGIEYSSAYGRIVLRMQAYREGKIIWIEDQFANEELLNIDGAPYFQGVSLCDTFDKKCNLDKAARLFSVDNDTNGGKYPAFYVNGQAVLIPEGPLKLDGLLFAPLGDEIARALGAQWQITRQGARSIGVVRLAEKNFIFRQDGYAVETDGGQFLRLSKAPFEFHGRFYIPLDAFALVGAMTMDRDASGNLFQVAVAGAATTVAAQPNVVGEPEAALYQGGEAPQELQKTEEAGMAESTPSAAKQKNLKEKGEKAARAALYEGAAPEMELMGHPSSRILKRHLLASNIHFLNRVIDYSSTGVNARMDVTAKNVSYAYGDGKWYEIQAGAFDFDRETVVNSQLVRDSLSGNSIQFKLGIGSDYYRQRGVELAGATLAYRQVDMVNPLPTVNATFWTLGSWFYVGDLDLGISHFNANRKKTETGFFARFRARTDGWPKPFDKFRLTAEYAEKDFQKYFIKSTMGERLGALGLFDFTDVTDSALSFGLQYVGNDSYSVDLYWYDVEDFSSIKTGLTYRY